MYYCGMWIILGWATGYVYTWRRRRETELMTYELITITNIGQ